MIKILAVAQTPPPYHGQSIMTEYFLQGKYQGLEIHHVRMAFSEDIKEVGAFQLKKVVQLISLISKIWFARFSTGSSILYYPPAGPNLVPIARDIVILLSTRFLFRKTIFHFHAAGLGEKLQQLPAFLRCLALLAYKAPDLSIKLSPGTPDDPAIVLSRSQICVPNGIPDKNPDRILGKSEAVFTILFLGTLMREKGIFILFEACKLLSEEHLDFKCVLAGAPDSMATELELQKACETAPLYGKVIRPGQVTGDSKWELYRTADVFCFPTYYSSEAFPVVLLEAMMFGLPVVSTKWRGIPDIVQDGETGFLVDLKNVRQVANAIRKLHQSNQLRRRMGSSARARFEKSFTLATYQRNMADAISTTSKSGN